MLSCLDGLIAAVALWLALVLRFDGRVPDTYTQQLTLVIPLFVCVRLVSFWVFGLYRVLWRYASVRELLVGGLAILAASIVLFVGDWLNPSVNLPRSVYAIEALLFALGAGSIRIFARLRRIIRPSKERTPRRTRVLIIGAGDAGAMLVQEFEKQPHLGVDVVGLVDDDVTKINRQLNGVRVLGRRDQVGELVRRYRVDQIIIAMPSVPQRVIQETINLCKDTGAQLKILPPLPALMVGNVRVQDVRDVQIEDLLRREPVKTDLSLISGYLRGRRVLVTGAGGSIGSELCRQVCALAPEQLIMVGHGENSIFEIQQELTQRFPDVLITPVIADIRDRAKMDRVFRTYKPHVVFHAAAHKHVPLMEAHPDEAITSNVLGTRNVAEAAANHGAERFVMVSTDKAVNPANVMGASKRLAELVVQAMQARGTGTRFVSVRFGNVLGSRGSVIPIFKKQIAQGGPVTVTHPEMRRYFMTIPEAVQLIIQAGAMGKGGEVFVLDMGEPVRIADLARDLIRLSGYEPDKDIKIVYTGPRPGEKLFEELINEGEAVHRTNHEKIMVLNGVLADPKMVEEVIEELEQLLSAESTTSEDLVRALFRAVGGNRSQRCEALGSAAGAAGSLGVDGSALSEAAAAKD